MFLVTTADQSFWKTDEPVLFLGEWCKLFSQRSVWEKLSYEVLPYHWDDRKKLYRDYLYLDKLYEQILSELSQHLNQIHGVKHSVRYWRIIVGRWLSYFIQIYYDRYQCILVAAESRKVTGTLIGKYDRKQWVPRDHRVFQAWAEIDEYNHYLYSRLIESTNRIPFNAVEIERDSSEGMKSLSTNKRRLSVLKTFLTYFIKCGCKLVPDCFNQIVLVSPPFKTCDLMKLQFSLGQMPYLPPQDIISPDSDVDWDLRKNFYFTSSRDEFEQLLSSIIKEQIPTVYVEGFKQMNEASLRAYPKKPKVILNATAFNSNDAFKFWAAHNANRGTKLAGTQHGGHYGTGLWSSTEEHEVKIYDRYYSWGWKSQAKENIKPLPFVKFNTTIRNGLYRKDGRLLLVLMAMPRYSYYMYSVPVASTGILSYFDDQYCFVGSLTEENQKLLLVRLYVHDYGWSQIDRWSNEFTDIECYSGNKTMTEQLSESRLFIGTYNATTYIETFAANYPSILFWNPNHWELRPSAEPYFTELRRVGILHDTPASAARKVNEICDDPLSWWRQPEIQEVKNEFCYQFARTSNNWLSRWRAELKKLKSGSQETLNAN